MHNQPRSAKVLVDHGASLEARSEHGQRPIDIAFEKGANELCEILRKPGENERMIAGCPEDLLDELFPKPEIKSEEVRFLSLNGRDPDDKLLVYFRKLWPGVRPRSRAEEIDPAAQPAGEAKTSYRDLKTKDLGMVVEITLEKEDQDTYQWSHRVATGPSLAGGGAKNRLKKIRLLAEAQRLRLG